ncbi:MAG: hypothetical protein C0473_01060 [Cyanobacteria bacterium DS3.002]|jgi:hypothetical protein|nr:hypothetical protein [Cyanobacteria bacterium DS3.002]
MNKIDPALTKVDAAYNVVVATAKAYREALSVLRQLRELHFDWADDLDNANINLCRKSDYRRSLDRFTARKENLLAELRREGLALEVMKDLAKRIAQEEQVQSLEKELNDNEVRNKKESERFIISSAVEELERAQREQVYAETTFLRVSPIAEHQQQSVYAAARAFYLASRTLAFLREEQKARLV